MVAFSFTNAAERQLQKFDPQTQQRILKKLSELKTHPSLLTVLEPVSNLEPATHRLRIGEYRLLVCLEEGMCVVLKIAHRREVYQ